MLLKNGVPLIAQSSIPFRQFSAPGQGILGLPLPSAINGNEPFSTSFTGCLVCNYLGWMILQVVA